MAATPRGLLARLAGVPRWLIGLAIVALFLLLQRWETEGSRYRIALVGKLEAIAYDARLRLTQPGTGDPQIVIIDIDEASLAGEGRWPWPRDKLARFVTQLLDRYQARAVAFDTVFAEPDTSGGMRVLDELVLGPLKDVPDIAGTVSALRPRLDYDARFAEAMRGRPVVLGFGFTIRADAAGQLPPPAFTQGDLAGSKIPIAPEIGFAANLPVLQRAAADAGHIDPVFDADGVIRRAPLVKRFGDAYYPALPLAVARIAVEAKGIVPRFDANGDLDVLDAGGLVVPVSRVGFALVPYRGPQGTFRYFSAGDVLRGTLPVDAFTGAIALVGTTAKGLHDIRSTPMGPDFPGVEIHANLLSGMLNGEMKSVPAGAGDVAALIMAVAGLLVVFAIPWKRPLLSVLGILLVAVAVVGINLALWTRSNAVIPLAPTLLMLLALLIWNLLTGFLRESRAIAQLTDMFGDYVPRERVRQMRESGERFSLEGESRELTVLFSDVRNFTALSERLPPREVSALMNAYLTPMTETIHAAQGTIDKYIGDAIMAFWGAPQPDPDHARGAVRAALAMQGRMPALRAQFRASNWPEFSIGVGVNTGPVNVGDMGSRFRKAYTVLGDAVNLASRLEALTKVYGVGILCGEATRRAAPGFAWREVDRVRVKGREQAIAIFEPLAEAADATLAAWLKGWDEALARYRARDFEGAALAFAELTCARPDDRLGALFRGRCDEFVRMPPPADWDGATGFTTK